MKVPQEQKTLQTSRTSTVHQTSRHWFSKFAKATDDFTSSPIATVIAFAIIVAWACFGPAAHYSEVWQLVINTGTTIVTFLMVFIIASSQKKSSLALMTKIDALVLALDKVDNKIVGIEDKEEEEIIQAKHDINQAAKEYSASRSTSPDS